MSSTISRTNIDEAGDRLIEEILSIMNRNEVNFIKKGRALCTPFNIKNFNNFFYNAIKTSTVNSVKIISQDNIRVPILNRKDSLFQKAFELKYINGHCGLNETNNYQNSIISSLFLFVIDFPIKIIPPQYKETCFIKIIIVRESAVRNDNSGPELGRILQLTNDIDNSDIPQGGYITAFSNLDSADNYQILATKTIHLQYEPKKFVSHISLNYGGPGADLIFRNQSFDNTKPPIIGNIYIAAIKKTIRNSIEITNETEDPSFDPEKEFEKLNETIELVNLETDVPYITMLSRHIVR